MKNYLGLQMSIAMVVFAMMCLILVLIIRGCS
jgi:hypothetical protein